MAFTSVKGVSEARRLPRLGIIRLGLKVQKAGGAEYPTETDYFVLTDAPGIAEKLKDDKPKELRIIFPVNNREVIFPQALKMYGRKSGLKCMGNGVAARRYNDEKKMWFDIACPCEHYGEDCNIHGNLLFFIPEVSWGGVYQIRTSSVNSIKNINSALDMYSGLLGRINMVPFHLTRKPLQVTHQGSARTHYILQLEFRGSTKDVMEIQGSNNRYLSLPAPILEAPDETNPELHAADIVEPPVDADQELPPPPMTPEQGAQLRDLMKKWGIHVKDDQTKFFMWHLERTGSEKTTVFAQSFIDNFKEIFNDYLTKDEPRGEAESDVPF